MNKDNGIEQLKVTALLKEYDQVRLEVRTFELLAVVCIFFSVIMFVIMFIGGIFSGRSLFFFISPAISIFFLICSMGMLAYITNLGIRSEQISSQLKKILGEITVDWENNVGIFAAVKETLFRKRINKYWEQIAILAIIVGTAPSISVMIYSFEQFLAEVGTFAAYLTLVLYALALIIGCIVFYRLQNWQKIEIKTGSLQQKE